MKKIEPFKSTLETELAQPQPVRGEENLGYLGQPRPKPGYLKRPQPQPQSPASGQLQPRPQAGLQPSAQVQTQPQPYFQVQPNSQPHQTSLPLKGGTASLLTTVEDPEVREDFDSHIYIHPSAEISRLAQIGAGSRIWQQVQIRERVAVGQECIIGDRVKIHNYVTIPQGVMIESGVFIGANVCFNNDFYPRAITTTGDLKRPADCDPQCTLVRYGASVGAGAVIFPGLRIGSFAMIAPGTVVTGNVADHQLVTGNPGQIVGYVCRCGKQLNQIPSQRDKWFCPLCEENYFFNDLNQINPASPGPGLGYNRLY